MKLSVLIFAFNLNELIRIFVNFIFKRCNLCKLYKNRCQKCQISQGGPLHPPDDESGGWQKIRGVGSTGGSLAPPWFWQGGGATPLDPPYNRLWDRYNF